jgi:hypothetical protein
LKPGKAAFCYSLTVAFIEVVSTEIGIGLFAGEQMISDHQNRMAHCYLSFLLAAARGGAVALRAQILILGVCGFDQAVRVTTAD